MEWIIKLWHQLPQEVQAILPWLFDKHLGETIAILSALLSWLSRRRISRIINRFRAKRTLRKRLPDFTFQEIERGIRYYIWPECQSVDPAQSDEVRHTVAVRNDLCTTVDRMLTQETVHKHFIVLADTGMGKTSFLLNYFARHLRRWRRPFNMELIPLGVPGLEGRLEDIAEPESAVLLLDAFDEDVEAIQDHTRRLSEIMDWTQGFERVVITCRTQFFPRDEEIPVETGIIKAGPRPAGEGPQFTLYKLYLSPFSDKQIQAYLKRRFPIWRKKRRRQARVIVDKIPNLAVRPMLLAYVDDLIGSGKSFENSYQIYAEMVDAWLERERKKVADKEALRDFSNKLAVDLFVNREKRGGERIPYHEIEPLAREFDIKLATWQLTGRSLLNRDAEGNYKFAHRSILEFLFAQRILAHEEEDIKMPPVRWTEPVKRFLWEGLNGKSLGLPNRFVRFEGGRFSLGEIELFGRLKGKKFKMKKTVDIKPFEMSIYPVTNGEYEEFDPSHREKRNEYSDQKDQPVVYVSWDEAVKYCRWLNEKMGDNYRLPTEAEWEFAASGGGKRQYPWGNGEPTPERANYYKSKIGKTTPVGSYPLGMTSEGLFDMAGNVWEWCADWYDKEKQSRVVRGGAFVVDRPDLRCSNRVKNDPHNRGDIVGFRVVRGV